MWILLRSTLRPIAPVAEDKRAQAKAMGDVKEDIAHSRFVLDDMSKVMAKMVQMGHQDTPEYRRVFTAYQSLSHLVTEASKELKEREGQEVKEMRATQPLPDTLDLVGIVPIKVTLGPAGRSGALSRGAEVTNLQRFLTAMGFTVAQSGEFDAKTRQAVLQFQGKYGLKADGMVGAATRKVINDLLKG